MALNRQQWLELRQKGIGGSDASSIVGENPYKTNVQLWREKTGKTIPEDISGKPYVKYGVESEKYLRELFVLDYPDYELEHKQYDIICHAKYPFLLGSLDGKLTHKETNLRGIFEAKTTNILSSQHKEKWNYDNIPQNYYIQLLHYLLITAYDFAIIKAQLKFVYPNKNINEIVPFEFKKVETKTIHKIYWRENVKEDIEYLLQEELKFWDYIQKDIEPPLQLPNI